MQKLKTCADKQHSHRHSQEEIIMTSPSS